MHDGFVNSYAAHQSNVLHFVSQSLALHPGYRLIFTGHSLGAAMATLAVFDAVTKLPELSQPGAVSVQVCGCDVELGGGG